MASIISTKSQQPLHNFPLPDLKWTTNSSTTHHQHRFRNKPAESTHKPPLIDDSVGHRAKHKKLVVSEKSKDKSKSNPAKIFIRIRNKKNFANNEIVEASDQSSVVAEADEPLAPKTWNLRPRKQVSNSKPSNGGSVPKARPQSEAQQDTKIQMPPRPCVGTEVNSDEKKPKFSILLSKEEIEEDIFALTGSKPSRRPKKRNRIVQKHLDNVFPGLWLGSVTPDSY